MMTRTQIKNYIREEIIEILTPAEAEETADALAQAADSAERIEKALSEEEVEEPTDVELRKSEDIVDVASKMTETAKEMKSLAKQYKAAEGEEKEDILKRLKELTKIKKELEGLI
jgi:hypothetical protein